MHGLSNESQMIRTKHRAKKFRVFGRYTLGSSPRSQTHGSGSDYLYKIMDSGAEEQAISHVDWRPLGEPSLRPAQVRLRSATGDNMGVIGSISVRGWCDEKMAELSVLAATRTTKSLCSASNV